MMKLCSIGKPSLQDLIIIIYPLIYFTASFINISVILNNRFASIFIECISWILCGVIILLHDLFRCFNQKYKSFSLEPTVPQFNKIEMQPSHKQKRIAIHLIFFCFVFFDWFTAQGYQIIFIYKAESITTIATVFCSIYFTSVMSIFTTHLIIYKHHYLALALIGLGLIILSIPFFILSKTLLSSLGIGIIQALSSSLFTVFLRYVMDNKFIRPLMLLLFNGVAGLFIVIIVYFLFLIFEFDSQMKVSILTVFSALLDIFSSWYNFGLVLAFLIVVSLINLTSFSIIYYHNPICYKNSFAIIYVFMFIQLIYLYGAWNYILTYLLIGVMLLIIGNLIYFEVIILYFFGLQKNTKNEIENRSYLEQSEDIEIIEQLS